MPSNRDSQLLTQTFVEPAPLGKTGLVTSRMILSSGYGIGDDGVRMAHERGQNFFHFSLRKPKGFRNAVTDLARRDREKVIVALHSYSRVAALLRRTVERELGKLNLDYADVLYLGYWQRKPFERIVQEALTLKERGLIRHLGIACHNRPLFTYLHAMGVFDVFMVRYNAAHRGAEQEVFVHLPPDHPAITTYTTTRWGDLVNPKKMPPGEPPPHACDCYRFALSHPRVAAAFCAPKNAHDLGECLAALDRGPMDEDELARMRRIGDYIHANHKKIFS